MSTYFRKYPSTSCTSERHIPHAVTLTRISSGSMSGTGTSSRTRALPYSCIRAAFMSASFPALVRKVPSSGRLSGGISSCRSAQSLYWHERRSTLVLDQKHQEFRRLGRARVSVDEVNIVGAFIEGLSRCQGYLFSPLQLHHDGA